LKKGRIIKLIGGIYTVMDEFKNRYDVKPLGVFRHQNISPKVGDFVLFDETTIHKVFDRTNDLVRPAICNIDQALLIQSSIHPNFSSILLDKFLVLIEFNHIKPIIVITKIDLLSDVEFKELKSFLSYYETYYQVFYVSSKTKEGINEVEILLKDKISVLTGQTGAGKSSLLNAIDPALDLETNEISMALGRGKHTTRHVELMEVCEGFIADTPGFSRLELIDIDEIQLKDCYPDFFEVSSTCKYHVCLHSAEPGCAVKTLVNEGKIPEERYQNYLKLLAEIKATPKKY